MKIWFILFFTLTAMKSMAQSESDRVSNDGDFDRPTFQIGINSSIGKSRFGSYHYDGLIASSVGLDLAFYDRTMLMRIDTGYEYIRFASLSQEPTYSDSIVNGRELRSPHFFSIPILFNLCVPISKRFNLIAGFNTYWGVQTSYRRSTRYYDVNSNEFLYEDSPEIQKKLKLTVGVGLSLGFEYFIFKNSSIELKGIISSRVEGGLILGSFYEFRGAQFSIKRTLRSPK